MLIYKKGNNKSMNNLDLMNYWINSSNNDYDTMNVLFLVKNILGVCLLDI